MSAGGVRSEPGGRAERPAGGAPLELPDAVRDRLADEVIDELLAGARTEEEIVGPGGVLAQLTKRLVERAMSAELTEHLGYEPHQEPPGGAGNTRNGSTAKTLATEHGPVEVETPRDGKGSVRAADRPEGSAALRGVRRQDPRALLARLVDPRHRGAPGRDLRRQGRPRPDQPRHRRGDGGRARVAAAAARRRLPGRLPRRAGAQDPRGRHACSARACYLALGVTVEGERDVLGMWFQETEGAKFWMQVLSRAQAARRLGHPALLRRRAEGLPGSDRGDLPADRRADVHRASDPAQPQVRAAREREQVARDLKPIYTAVDADAAQAALEAFDEKWGARFPVITQAWLNAWEYVTPFLAFPPELRRVVYTTNAIEALNRQLRKAIKTKGHFPNEEAARKLIYLAIINAVPAWTRTRNWTTALLAFKIHFGDRLPE